MNLSGTNIQIGGSIVAKNAATEAMLGDIHKKFTEIIDNHLDECLTLNELPENATMNVIKSFLNDNKIYAQEFIVDTESRTAKIIEMKRKRERTPNMLEANDG